MSETYASKALALLREGHKKEGPLFILKVVAACGLSWLVLRQFLRLFFGKKRVKSTPPPAALPAPASRDVAAAAVPAAAPAPASPQAAAAPASEAKASSPAKRQLKFEEKEASPTKAASPAKGPVSYAAATAATPKFERSPDELFEAAADFAKNLTKTNQTGKLALYGLFKQSKEGPCTAKKPGMFDPEGQLKHGAWSKLGGLPKDQAKMQYVELVDKLSLEQLGTSFTASTASSAVKGNAGTAPVPVAAKTSGGAGNASGGGGAGGMAPVNSRPVVDWEGSDEEENAGADKDIFYWAVEGSLPDVRRMISAGIKVGVRDGEGRTVLHLAADRGHLALVQALTELGADVNAQDGEGQTPLHYACICENEAVALFLIKNKANLQIKDNDGAVPLSHAPSKLRATLEKAAVGRK